MTKKEARAECRRLAIEKRTPWWPLCWDKQNGYYPTDQYVGSYTTHICWVDRSGKFMYASKENEKKHQLKGNIPWRDPLTGKRK